MRRAFTLIELLVVISIIALLIGLTLPALASARKEAQALFCATRVRQVMQAGQFYSAQSKDYLPFANSETAESSGKWDGPGWLYVYHAQPYTYSVSNIDYGSLFTYLTKYDVYRCPMDLPPYNQGMLATMSSYVMNVAVHGSGMMLPSYRVPEFRPNAVIFWENDELGGPNNFNDGNNEPTQGISGRHNHSGNYAAIDGSVKRRSVTDFFLMLNDAPGPLWCNPGQADGKY